MSQILPWLFPGGLLVAIKVLLPLLGGLCAFTGVPLGWLSLICMFIINQEFYPQVEHVILLEAH